MKKLLMISICLTIQCGSWANSDTLSIDPNQTVNVSQLSELTQSVKDLQNWVNIFKYHETWIISIVALLIALIAAFAYGLINKAKKEITSKLTNAKDNIYNELAENWNMDKKAFKKAIDIKAIELDLMSDYPLYIIL